MGARWTEEEEDIMRELGHEGVAAVAGAIFERCGTLRSTDAINRHASRIRVSLRRQEVCPECGVVGLPLNKVTGLCPACTLRRHISEELAFEEALWRERMATVGGESYQEMRRAYEAERRRSARVRERFGLPGKREQRKGSGPCLCPSCELWKESGGCVCDSV